MAKSPFIFEFKSFRTRLITFLLALLIPVLGGVFYYVNSNNTEYTEETINRYLQLGAEVFDDSREQQAYTLEVIIDSLTWDFAFRSAFGSRDPGTLFDAALNVLDRSQQSADMLMIVDLDYQVLIDTKLQGFESLDGSWAQLLDRADANEEGNAEAILDLSGSPYQVIALPLYLPRQVAWIIGGFALDAEFVQGVAETTVSDVSMVRISPEGELDVIASTLPVPRQELLSQQLVISDSLYSELQRIDFIEEEYTTLLRPLYSDLVTGMQVAAVIQRSFDENNANVVQARQLLIRFYLAVLIISVLAVLYLARSITLPIARLATTVKRIGDGQYTEQVELGTKDELGQLASSVNSMAKGLLEKEKVRDLLGKVVSHQIAEQLLNNPVELGGEERVVTILFSDIRGFTSYCEGLPPKQVLEELNRVLSKISEIVETHQGVVDKYQGDAVMALFGAPIQGEDDAPNAMSAALEIIAALNELDSELTACVGINTGTVVAGNLGSESRLNYSVIGDAVNLSARLESLTRFYNVSNIVSEASKEAAPQFRYRELDEVQVAGKTESIKIFELIGDAALVDDILSKQISEFESALSHFRQKEWDAAEALFSQLQKQLVEDTLCKLFLARIAQFRNTPPPENWQGVHIFDKK